MKINEIQCIYKTREESFDKIMVDKILLPGIVNLCNKIGIEEKNSTLHISKQTSTNIILTPEILKTLSN